MKPAVAPAPATNVVAAGKVARVVELMQVRLASMRFDSSFGDDPPGEFEMKQFMTHRFAREEEGDGLLAIVGYRLALEAPEEQQAQPGRPDVEIEAHFQAFYRVKDLTGLTDVDFDCFAELNGTLNTYPYWRELVQSMTSRAGLGGIVMPVWRAQTRKLEPPQFVEGT